MDIETLFYHQALGDLSRASREFANAILRAAETAEKLPHQGDDLLAIRTFEDCRDTILKAFAVAPGMIQILSGKGE